MSNNASRIVARIAELEAELERDFAEQIAAKQKEFRYSVERGRVAFDAEMCALHGRLRKGWLRFLWDAPALSLLVAPVIYSLSVPLVLFDAWLWVYQAICFPVYGIKKVERRRYISFDRSKLHYLNWIEGANCNYCGYANGLIAYAREVASRTEQYFCPIKHAARTAGAHERYRDFVDFGDAEAYRVNRKKLRDDLKP
ncbi:MAG TPA: hypothetical protein VH309_00600 [Elusimicrobiota bacterium]|nr:hypothetical protein [Elusimicrobiota bacterium]